MPNSPANAQSTLVFSSSFILTLLFLCMTILLFDLFKIERSMTSLNAFRSKMKAKKILQK